MSFVRASELYAISQQARCSGPEECHWCSAPCGRVWIHDDPPSLPFVRGSKTLAKRPGNHYICVGCWLFRRKNLSIQTINGLQKDKQKPVCHSWWITNKGAWSVTPLDHEDLYEHLLNPPHRFTLALLDGECENQLHLMACNDVEEVRADTPLQFTINNVPHSYTVYELKEAIKFGEEGKEPGVRALLRHLGVAPEWVLPRKEKKEEKRGRGRPPREITIHQEERLSVTEVVRPFRQSGG